MTSVIGYKGGVTLMCSGSLQTQTQVCLFVSSISQNVLTDFQETCQAVGHDPVNFGDDQDLDQDHGFCI